MSAQIIDGQAIAMEIRQELKQEIENLKQKGIYPGLAVIMVGDDPASQLYVKMKEKAAQEIGLYSVVRIKPAGTTQAELLHEIAALNVDPRIHGYMVQLPLAPPLNEREILEAIRPEKDVDCFHPYNVGRLLIGQTGFKPCTPLGCMIMLERTGASLEGKKAVVVGRSNIVGKPMAVLLMQQNATVTLCHSKTKDLTAELRQADIVVAAVGIPRFITGAHLKPGAIVIDVGINRLPNGKVVGDVDFSSAGEVASWITPVPRGVGPMTIAMLLKNAVEAAKIQCTM